jgi:hypothetical protein
MAQRRGSRAEPSCKIRWSWPVGDDGGSKHGRPSLAGNPGGVFDGKGQQEEGRHRRLLNEVHAASDRTAAIVLGSWVERELEQWIISVLPRRNQKTIEKARWRPEQLLRKDSPRLCTGALRRNCAGQLGCHSSNTKYVCSYSTVDKLRDRRHPQGCRETAVARLG